MPRKKTPTDPEALVEAVDSHVSMIAGVPVAVRRGDRLRADHPAVAQNRAFFVEVGLDDAEKHRIRQRTFPLPNLPAPPRKPEPARMMRATRNLRLRGVALPGGKLSHGVTEIPEGTLLAESHPIVGIAKDGFEPVE